MMDKKKRNVSGSRSKSKQSKPKDASVLFRTHKLSHNSHSQEHSCKVRTQNSVSVYKSRGSRKNSKRTKKSNRGQTKDSKDISYSISAERNKQSLAKINRTEANFEAEDIERRIYHFKKELKKIQHSQQGPIRFKTIHNVYNQIRETIETISEPLYSIFLYMHEIYCDQLTNFMKLVQPYEQALEEKHKLTNEIERQARQNEKLYQQLSPDDLYIYDLKQKIDEQRAEIKQKAEIKDKVEKLAIEKLEKLAMDKMEKLTLEKMEKQAAQKIKKAVEQKMDKADFFKKTNGNTLEHNYAGSSASQGSSKKSQEPFQSPNQTYMQPKQQFKGDAATKNGTFKLNLSDMNKVTSVQFHEQFYSHIDEFSESWRQQALREKRF